MKYFFCVNVFFVKFFERFVYRRDGVMIFKNFFDFVFLMLIFEYE